MKFSNNGTQDGVLRLKKIVFELPNGKGKGICIWEPLSTWESVFDKEGKSNDLLLVYDSLAKQFLAR